MAQIYKELSGANGVPIQIELSEWGDASCEVKH